MRSKTVTAFLLIAVSLVGSALAHGERATRMRRPAAPGARVAAFGSPASECSSAQSVRAHGQGAQQVASLVAVEAVLTGARRVFTEAPGAGAEMVTGAHSL
jgi:hypothetical protein